ncbi:MAG: hypothetical protein ACRDJV_14935 [Actinomycetota bacterium]
MKVRKSVIWGVGIIAAAAVITWVLAIGWVVLMLTFGFGGRWG